MPQLSIELERPSAVFYAGEVVRGTVRLFCPTSLTCRAFHVYLKGQASVHWHTGSGDNRNDYDGSTVYQDQRQTIWGNFYKTGSLYGAGENAYFDKFYGLGVLYIPCSAAEPTAGN